MRRTTIILLFVFLALGALVWYMQQPINQLKLAIATLTNTPATETKILISPEKGPISQVSVRNSTGETVVIDRVNGIWEINHNKENQADQDLSESAAGQCLNLKIIKSLENAPNPAGTGLINPDYFISCKLADGTFIEIKIGRKTVTNSGYYAETSDKSIYILGKNEIESLIQNVTEPPFIKKIDQTPPDGTSKAGPSPY